MSSLPVEGHPSGPGSSSVLLAALQQASSWMLCRDNRFLKGPGHSQTSPHLGDPQATSDQKSTLACKDLLTNCLTPAKESKQVSSFSCLFFPARLTFFSPSLAPLAGNWPIPAPSVLTRVQCRVCGSPPSQGIQCQSSFLLLKTYKEIILTLKKCFLPILHQKL